MADISKPVRDDWGSALEAVEAALHLERNVNQTLLDLHATAGSHNDAQMCDFLEGNYLNEQVDSIKNIADLITKMKRAGNAVGLHIIDEELK